MTGDNPLSCRWLIRRDVEECLEIVGITPWDADDMVAACGQRNATGVVCELDEIDIQGWMVYTMQRTHFTIENMSAYDWEFGAAYELVQRLVDKLKGERDTIMVTVPEDQDDILLFFRSCGFTAACTSAGQIVMRYMLPNLLTMTRLNGVPISRVSGFPCLVPGQKCNE